jgi:hypothetical protein
VHFPLSNIGLLVWSFCLARFHLRVRAESSLKTKPPPSHSPSPGRGPFARPGLHPRDIQAAEPSKPGPNMDVDMAADAAPPAPAPAPTTPASVGSPGALKLAEPRRRNRPALSCIQCRTRKIRCDRNEPCASCMKSKIVNCTYEEARRPKPRLWRLSPAPGGAHHPEHSPTSTDERTAVGGSAFTFRDMGTPTAPPTSDPSCSGPSTASLGKAPEPLSAASPRSLSQMHHVNSAQGTAGPVGNTAALAERVRQLEQQLADALGRPDYGSPPSKSALAALSLDPGPPFRPHGANSLLNEDKLVGRPSHPLHASTVRPYLLQDGVLRPSSLSPLAAGRTTRPCLAG